MDVFLYDIFENRLYLVSFVSVVYVGEIHDGVKRERLGGDLFCISLQILLLLYI